MKEIKKNPYATNQNNVIKAPKPLKEEPKATVVTDFGKKKTKK